MIIEDIAAFLAADAGVSALIGTRIYPMLLPQNATKPAVVYSQVSGVRVTTHDKAKNFTDQVYQLQCIADDPKSVKNLSEKVRQAMEGFQGTMGATNVQGVFMTAERDAPYQLDSLTYRTDLDFRLYFLEA
jgi:hypothetical protein